MVKKKKKESIEKISENEEMIVIIKATLKFENLSRIF